MCGIGCVLANSCCEVCASDSGVRVTRQDIESAIKNRGPHATGFSDLSTGFWAIGSVLHIQGSEIVNQPYVDESDNILLWNGEVFSGMRDFTPGISDTLQVSSAISFAIQNVVFESTDLNRSNSRVHLSKAALRAVTDCLSHVNGPYAFIYFCNSLQLLIYGRDPLGRRSLLKLRNDKFPFALSSVWPSNASTHDNFGMKFEMTEKNDNLSDHGTDPNHEADIFTGNQTAEDDDEVKWEEIPVTGLFGCINPASDVDNTASVDLQNGLNIAVNCVVPQGIFEPWPIDRVKLCRLGSAERSRLDEGMDLPADRFEVSSKLLLDALLTAVQSRVSSVGFKAPLTGIAGGLRVCRIGVLFSGGIDSVVLAALLHLSLSDPEEPIDLLNVAFASAGEEDISQNGIAQHQVSEKRKSEPPAPDRLAAISALKELKLIYPTRDWRLVHVDVSSAERNEHEGRVKGLIRPRDTHMDLNIGTALWFASRGQGYLRDYTEEEMAAAGGTRDAAGRPLVRTGGDGAAQSVGLPSWNQKVQSTSATVTDDALGSDAASVAQTQGMQCGNAECRRVGKRGCPRGMCKRCCNKKESTDSPTATASSTVTDGISGSGMRSISNAQCHVHKSSAKELEKMAKKQKEKKSFLEGHNPCEEQASMIVSEEQLHAVECSAVETSVSPEVAPCSSQTAYSTSCRALLIGIGADEQMVGAVCSVLSVTSHYHLMYTMNGVFPTSFAPSSTRPTLHVSSLRTYLTCLLYLP
jgi:hypothetical protein